MKIGDKASCTKIIGEAEITEFNALIGNREMPNTIPKPLINSLFSYLLGVKLPGPGTNYLKQSNEWVNKAEIDTPLTAEVEVTRLRPEKHLVDLKTTCTDDKGNIITRGRAFVYVVDLVID